VIGFLNGTSPDLSANPLRAFHQSLRETGYVEGQNVRIEYKWAQGKYDQFPDLAADLVRRRVSVIATTGGISSALAAKAATTTIPIVFVTGTDPVAFGLVGSLNRPGGNLTGITALSDEVGPKRLELLHEMLPAAGSLALLHNPAGANAETQLRDMQAAARVLGVQLPILHATTDRDLESIFAAWTQMRAGALVIGPNNFFFSRTEQIAALALRYAVPTIFQYRDFVAAGGLMSYGAGTGEAWRLAGVYAARILKGDKPADLPVQQATKIELIINMKTAKALGLTFPITLLGRADEVIE
jgi:putative tryptophan/tyrosine transport system substrate-binding protein